MGRSHRPSVHPIPRGQQCPCESSSPGPQKGAAALEAAVGRRVRAALGRAGDALVGKESTVSVSGSPRPASAASGAEALFSTRAGTAALTEGTGPVSRSAPAASVLAAGGTLDTSRRAKMATANTPTASPSPPAIRARLGSLASDLAPSTRSGVGRSSASDASSVAAPARALDAKNAISASCIARADSQRSFRSMHSARITMESRSRGTSGDRWLGAGAGSVRILASTAIGEVDAWAHPPVSISKSMAPTDQTSARASISKSPRACSGDM